MKHPTKHAIILCDGDPPPLELLKQDLSHGSLLVATDGGAATALDFDIIPDIVIGDMDSLDLDKTYPFPIIKDDDQETNDLEKALRHVHDQQIETVIILGATGQRLDHTLKNLSVLKQFSGKFSSIYMKDRFGTLLLLPRDYRFRVPEGIAVSLYPLSGKVEGIQTSGLKYSLTDETLENGIRDGSSNESVSTTIRIRHKRGDLLIFISRSDHFETGWFEP